MRRCICIAGLAVFACYGAMALADNTSAAKPVPPQPAAPDSKRIVVDGTNVEIMRFGDYLRSDTRPSSNADGYTPLYYVLATGSLTGMLPLPKDVAMRWLPVRILPIRASEAPRGVMSGSSIVFERQIQHKHATVLGRMWDHATPRREELKDVERLYVGFYDRGSGSTEEAIRQEQSEGTLPIRFIGVPLSDKGGAPLPEGLLFDSDFEATTFCGNLRVTARANYSDVRNLEDTMGIITNDTAVITTLVHVKNYLGTPFPKSADVLHPKTEIIEAFELGEKEVSIGHDVPLKMAFSAKALGASEIVRLSTNNGGFRSKDGAIVYRPVKPGDCIVTLEVLSGIRRGGKMDYAARKELRFTVKQKQDVGQP